MWNSKQETQQRPVTATVRAADTARALCDGEIVLAAIDVPASPERVVRALMTAEPSVPGWVRQSLPGKLHTRAVIG